MKQFVQVVGMPLSGPPWPDRLVDEPFPPKAGLPGRLGATELIPLMVPLRSGGELGVECADRSYIELKPIKAAFGVEAVLGIFCRRSFPLRRTSAIELLEAWICAFPSELPEPSQSSGDPSMSVDPPIVTCFLGGPPGYRAA